MKNNGIMEYFIELSAKEEALVHADGVHSIFMKAALKEVHSSTRAAILIPS